MTTGTLPNRRDIAAMDARRLRNRDRLRYWTGRIGGSPSLARFSFPLFDVRPYSAGLLWSVSQSYRFAADDVQAPPVTSKAVSWVMRQAAVYAGVLGHAAVQWTRISGRTICSRQLRVKAMVTPHDRDAVLKGSRSDEARPVESLRRTAVRKGCGAAILSPRPFCCISLYPMMNSGMRRRPLAIEEVRLERERFQFGFSGISCNVRARVLYRT